MSTKNITQPKHCMDGKNDIAFAKLKGCNVRHGKGDHEIVEINGNSIPIPNRDLGFGLACEVFKFFIKCNLITKVIILAFLFESVYFFVDMGFTIPFLPHI